MTLLTIEIPDKNAEIVKTILKKFGVKILSKKSNIPNELTKKTIENAKNKIDLEEPIKNINNFLKSC